VNTRFVQNSEAVQSLRNSSVPVLMFMAERTLSSRRLNQDPTYSFFKLFFERRCSQHRYLSNNHTVFSSQGQEYMPQPLLRRITLLSVNSRHGLLFRCNLVYSICFCTGCLGEIGMSIWEVFRSTIREHLLQNCGDYGRLARGVGTEILKSEVWIGREKRALHDAVIESGFSQR
jgi:hypothetical protein